MKSKLILLSIVMIGLTGCSMLPSTKNQSRALNTLETLQGQNALSIHRTLETRPVVPAKVAKQEKEKPPVISSKPTPPNSEFDAMAWAWPFATKETIEITDNSSYGAGSTEVATANKETTIPFGTKLILAGVGLIFVAGGILAMLYAWKRVKQSSVAISAASHAADQFAAGLIRNIRQRATVSTDPREIAQLNSEIAALEAERGKVASSPLFAGFRK